MIENTGMGKDTSNITTPGENSAMDIKTIPGTPACIDLFEHIHSLSKTHQKNQEPKAHMAISPLIRF